MEEHADSPKAVNMDAAGVIRSSYPCYIQYEYERPFTCRNVEVILSGNNYQAHRLKVMASDDGVNFHLVKQLVPAVRDGRIRMRIQRMPFLQLPLAISASIGLLKGVSREVRIWMQPSGNLI